MALPVGPAATAVDHTPPHAARTALPASLQATPEHTLASHAAQQQQQPADELRHKLAMLTPAQREQVMRARAGAAMSDDEWLRRKGKLPRSMQPVDTAANKARAIAKLKVWTFR